MKVRIGIPIEDPRERSSNVVDEILGSVADLSSTSGISCTRLPQPSRHAFPGQELLLLVFSFPVAISAGVIANWLYDKIRNRGTTIIIGSKEVRIENAEKLREIIIEEASESD